MTLLFLIALLTLAAFQKAFAKDVNQEATFEARVLEIIEEKEIIADDGSKSIQQDIKLRGLTNEWKNKEFFFYGTSNIQISKTNVYRPGDRVLVGYTRNSQGEDLFYIIDYIRRDGLYFLAAFFALVIILIAKWKGAKALFSLLISFIVIIKFIVPKILAGSNPLFIGVIGSLLILLLIIYLTEGINKKSHLAILSIFICLIITALLSVIFTYIIKLTGMAQEEAMYLVGIGKSTINFKGLLLAGILIGTLGILDDIVISQVEAIDKIKKANPSLAKKEVFAMALQIGHSHLGAVINTLFLAYAGASLPLLLLFSLRQPPFLTFGQTVSNEIIATEIARTLIGSIGLALSVTIATLLATYFHNPKNIIKKSQFDQYRGIKK